MHGEKGDSNAVKNMENSNLCESNVNSVKNNNVCYQ